MKTMILAAVVSLAAGGAAVAQTATSPTDGTMTPVPAPAETTAAPAPAAAPMAAADPAMANLTAQQFVEMAASGGLFEVRSSELALERSQSDDVKAFAQMMIADHGKANDELKALATAKNLTVPAEPAGPPADHLAAVMAAEGDNFDPAYVEHQAQAHAETIQLFQAEAASSNDADLAAFAEKTLPTLQMHAEHVQGLASQ
ncbi:DUF4142 domain-containing protein [Paracoccus luteus]|uniref:DUF4142 domain-containing protein n=1 Tax=Paracoccus luteus TaxID=2508543 RepID=UPI0010702528|nr:DUF4142 domain-containing protein [Paracoccus luteus]